MAYPLMTCELALIDKAATKISYLTHSHTQSVREVTPLLIGFLDEMLNVNLR